MEDKDADIEHLISTATRRKRPSICEGGKSKPSNYRWSGQDRELIGRLHKELGAKTEIDTIRIALLIAQQMVDKANQ